MNKINYYTEEGLKKLQKELLHLEKVERPAISKQIAEARDKGDLSENAEYHAAKEAQGILEMKIAKLNEAINNARIIDQSELDNSKAYILSKVQVLNTTINKEFKFILVAPNEADIKNGKISVDSPIGKSLLGKSVGDLVTVDVPNGKLSLKILNISR